MMGEIPLVTELPLKEHREYVLATGVCLLTRDHRWLTLDDLYVQKVLETLAKARDTDVVILLPDREYIKAGYHPELVEHATRAYTNFYRHAGQIVRTSELKQPMVSLPVPWTVFGRNDPQKREIVKEFARGVLALAKYLEKPLLFVNHASDYETLRIASTRADVGLLAPLYPPPLDGGLTPFRDRHYSASPENRILLTERRRVIKEKVRKAIERHETLGGLATMAIKHLLEVVV